MDFLPEEFEEILNIFRGETEEIIQKLNNNLLQLENNPNNKELIVYLFRDAHSLKGAARMIGFNNIQRLAHKIEDVLGLAKENKINLNKEILNAFYNALDLLTELIQESVRLKKEYYSDNIQKHIDTIDYLLETYQKEFQIEETIIAKRKKQTEQQPDAEFEKTAKAINGLLSEAYLLIVNMTGEDASNYTETFLDIINQVIEKLKDTDYYDVKSELKNIKDKISFVMFSTGMLTNDEVTEICEKLEAIVNQLNIIYEKIGIATFNIKEKIASKTDVKNISDNDNQENIDENNSIIQDFFEKLEFTKNGFTNLEKNLSQIPELKESLEKIIDFVQNKELTNIVKKIQDILEFIKSSNTLPEKEVINILKQSLSSIEQIALDSNNNQEDITLIIQRLDIIKQMLDINSTVTPLSKISTTLNDSLLPIKKTQDFFNSFEATSIKTLRVDSKKLDKLVNQIGELIIGRIKYKKNFTELEELLTLIAEWKNFNNKSQSFIKYYDRKYLNGEVQLDYATLSIFIKQIFSIFQENSARIIKLNSKVLNLQKSVDEEDAKLNIITTQLEEMVKNIRVLPLATIFHMFPRMIRDIAQDTGKEIELLISGSETSADKKVIEEIKAPLIHIIRNSIDHGIETPQERIAVGKPPKGKIYLVAKNHQNKITIEIHDDGRGIDLQKIVARALEKGMITPKEAEYLSAEQIMNIIFWPGFSTEQTVTEISGRGVGLDIVQTKISQLNGSVKVYSIPNQGTKITIELPISMSTLKAFIVEASNQYFAIPMTSIKNVMWIKKEDIYERNETKSIIIEGKSVNLYSLSELMQLQPSRQDTEKQTVILIEAENGTMGITIDKIHGDQNILQKKLEAPIMKLKNISGITTLVNGEVCLILNMQELYKSTYTTVEKPLLPVKKHLINKKTNKDYKILIVDDSITTRELLKNILRHWGYNFDVAANPKEAFELLYKSDFDLILSDIEMPEMNGQEFIRELKNHSKFKDIPVVIISSYESDDFGIITGAETFIKKSNFNQEYLLDILEKLLKDD